MPHNKGFVLASRPKGAPTRANFRLVESQTTEPIEGQVLVKHHFMSLDPYMRGRMDDAKSYAAPQQIDAIMGGGTVGEVVASKNPRFKVGDHVVGMGGWQLYSLSDGQGLMKVDGSKIPLSAYLGVVGMPGVTAWYGLNKIIAPKKGGTIVVSAATGAVGSVVGQLAKFAGARTVGIAGGPEKCAYAKSELGYDLCVDHRSADFAAEMKAALPDGVDGLFENVGGEPFKQTIRRLNPFARIAVCGLIASYNGEPTPLPDMRAVLVARARIEGFIVSDHMNLWPEALAELSGHVASGKLKYRETVAHGIESAPDAFLGLLTGKNFGKQVVKLA
jgi:NADPH-dependent curcumin reductase CurA